MRGLSSAAAALFAASASLAAASTVVYDFNITWVIANPDGAFPRPVIGINNQWPIPRIEAEVNDQIIVNVNNQLGNQSTSLHFHGLFQNGTSYNDGPVGVSQCGIAPGGSFTYNFTIQQTGTYWYHSHVNTQYPDGLRGPLIITDPNSPYKDQVDEELILTLSDWYHDQVADILPVFINKANPTGAEPIPDAALMNETQNYTISVQPNKTYLFRVINIGAFASMYLWIEGHTMQVVEVDGVYTEAAEADMVFIAVAQRVSFLVTTKNDTSANFPIVASMDTTLFDVVPPTLNWNVTGWLTYDSAAPLPTPQIITEFDPIDDMTLVPYDHQAILPEPDQIVELDVIMANLGNGANYAFFNNITYVSPKVPSLYTVLSSGDLANDSTVYGTFTHPFVLQEDQIIQIVVNNLDTGRHPFHLHGHQFQAVYRAPENAGTFESLNISESSLNQVPMRRDTLIVWPGGNIVLRFKADNPGVWLFHCHIEWHVAGGLMATMIEAPLAIQEQYSSPPADHLAACALGGNPTAGNAAGNTVDLLDLSSQPSPPAPLPAGFTPRGIAALVFSCISGILGIAVVAWYGLSLPVEAVPAGFARIVAETGESPEADIAVVQEIKSAAVAATTAGASARTEH